MRQARGFTLVELLVVLAIAAMAMAAVPPLISAAMPGVEMKAAARRTLASLRLTREVAIRQGRSIALIIDVQEHRLEIPGHRPLTLPRRLDLSLEAAEREMLDEQRGAIRFFADGSSTGGRVLLAHGDSGYQIGVNWLTGHARMAAWEPE
ncbi:MAG: type II secretion system protein GspH [Sphingobacteriia bacterium]|nr:type II secretion system protein GspH [Sphingobacteriia bacterium]NCC38671.1 type II secretion system protein GspH [Gammaproteobacteria bacterium]